MLYELLWIPFQNFLFRVLTISILLDRSLAACTNSVRRQN